jgi:hypothetical protein
MGEGFMADGQNGAGESSTDGEQNKPADGSSAPAQQTEGGEKPKNPIPLQDHRIPQVHTPEM